MGAVLAKPKRKRKAPINVGPDSNGIVMTPEEIDRADFDDGYCYELIRGVLIVSPIPSEAEADPNEELGHLVRTYRDSHPEGKALDITLFERFVHLDGIRRRVDRAIWAGFGRMPKPSETPSISSNSSRRANAIANETTRSSVTNIKKSTCKNTGLLIGSRKR